MTWPYGWGRGTSLVGELFEGVSGGGEGAVISWVGTPTGAMEERVSGNFFPEILPIGI